MCCIVFHLHFAVADWKCCKNGWKYIFLPRSYTQARTLWRCDKGYMEMRCAFNPLPRPWRILGIQQLKSSRMSSGSRTYLRENNAKKLYNWSILCVNPSVPVRPRLHIWSETSQFHPWVWNWMSQQNPELHPHVMEQNIWSVKHKLFNSSTSQICSYSTISKHNSRQKWRTWQRWCAIRDMTLKKESII